MSEDKRKHLEFIQNIITRMNTNSFLIKGWTITIVSAVIAIFASTKNIYFLLLGTIPTIIFWLLDTYYLLQERKFRGLYNDVAGVSNKPKTIKLFELNPELYTSKDDDKYSYCNVLWSKTIYKMYLTIVILLIVGFSIFYCN